MPSIGKSIRTGVTKTFIWHIKKVRNLGTYSRMAAEFNIAAERRTDTKERTPPCYSRSGVWHSAALFLVVGSALFLLAEVSLFAASITICILLATEYALKWSGRIRSQIDRTDFIPTLFDTTVEQEQLCFDRELGWRNVTNLDYEASIRIPSLNLQRTFRYTTDADGKRTVAERSAAGARQRIAIFGCSITFGNCLSDNEHYPALLQSALPHYQIENRGVSGYSGFQCLLALEQLLKNDPPAAVIFGYHEALDHRNVNSIRTRSWFCGPTCLSWPLPWLKTRMLRCLQAPYIKFVGAERCNLIKLAETFYNCFSPLGRNSAVVMHHTMRRVFEEMRRACESHGVKFLVAELHTQHAHAKFLLKEKFNVCSPGLNIWEGYAERQPRWTLFPFDSHPNARAQEIYADAIAKAVEQMFATGSVISSNALTVSRAPSADEYRDNLYALF